MGSSKKIVSGVLWSTLVNLVNAVYGFIAVPILINHFGKAEYGLIGLAMSINVYMQLMDMGFNSTNVRFFSTWLAENEHNKLTKAFQTSLSFYGIIGLVNAFVFLIVAFCSNVIFNVTCEQDIILKHLFYILSLNAFFNWFSSCFDQLVKATEDIAWLQKRTLLTKILMVFVLLSTVYGDLTIEVYYFLTCLCSLVIVPLSIKKIKRDLPFISFKLRFNKAVFKEMLPYTMNIFSFSLFQFSFYNLRPVFLGIEGSIESVADYRILNGIIGIVTMLGGAFTSILLPSSAKVVAQNNEQAYYRMAYDGTRYISIMISFCCFGLMCVGPEILSLYVGESYLYLIPWLNLWLICTLATHNQAISSLILAGSDIRAISYCSAISSCVGLILSWILIPYYQIGGVCIAFAIYNVMQLTFFYFYYWPVKMKIQSQQVFFKSFLPFVSIGFVLCIIVKRVELSNLIVSFFVKGGTFALAYMLIVGLLLPAKDKKFIGGIISSKL